MNDSVIRKPLSSLAVRGALSAIDQDSIEHHDTFLMEPNALPLMMRVIPFLLILSNPHRWTWSPRGLEQSFMIGVLRVHRGFFLPIPSRRRAQDEGQSGASKVIANAQNEAADGKETSPQTVY